MKKLLLSFSLTFLLFGCKEEEVVLSYVGTWKGVVLDTQNIKHNAKFKIEKIGDREWFTYAEVDKVYNQTRSTSDPKGFGIIYLNALQPTDFFLIGLSMEGKFTNATTFEALCKLNYAEGVTLTSPEFKKATFTKE